MADADSHNFHIPVMGIGFTIDTPLKVARFGISSVMSLVDDNLIEQMRKFYSEQSGEDYEAIEDTEVDHRARRITAYLNLVNKLVKKQLQELRALPFTSGSEIVKYFKLLPNNSFARQAYEKMKISSNADEQRKLQEHLRSMVKAGSIDVNIMVKLDRVNYTKNDEPLPPEYSDGVSALRGFAKSDLESSVVFSAGYNPRIYNYVEQFNDFFPDENGYVKKKIIIKVSDYRSALVQGKVFAKKGIFISEFRIESGLNCGGHAFATDGLLLGPILQEFKDNRASLENELITICNASLEQKGKNKFLINPQLKITVQGGLGTANEQNFLLEYYNLYRTGWGSPFLLVPEVTNVDSETLYSLASAKKEDYYLSDVSPLGVPFNNFRWSSSEKQKNQRIQKGRPGSPCYNKFLVSNLEFTKTPICTASREYQNHKINQLKGLELSPEEYKIELNKITEKECICTGLSVTPLLVNHLPIPHKLSAVSICPGPNLAYFSGTFSLKQMVDHIYGRSNILNPLKRPNLFINELLLYVEYLSKKILEFEKNAITNQDKYIQTFRENLISGINYYRQVVSHFKHETASYIDEMRNDLSNIEKTINNLLSPVITSRGIDHPLVNQ